jgi:hypothetical protein
MFSQEGLDFAVVRKPSPNRVLEVRINIGSPHRAFHVHKTNHGPGATPHLHETAFDHIGSTQLLPQVPGEAEERQQLPQSSISACISLREAGRVQKHQRRFGAMTQDLRELAEWLRQFGVTQVAMESSGVYWKPVWNILERQFTVVWRMCSTSRMCRVARPTRRMRNGLRSCCSMVFCGPAMCPARSSAIYAT